MDKIVFLIEADEIDGGYTAKAINHGIFTEANDLDTLKLMIKDTIKCHFEEENLPLKSLTKHTQIYSQK